MNWIKKISNKLSADVRVLLVDKSPDKTDYLTRKDFLDVEIGDYIHCFTECFPTRNVQYRYNSTRRVKINDKLNKILTLEDIKDRGKGRMSEINYSGLDHHPMSEEGETTRGSESFECWYQEKYTITTK